MLFSKRMIFIALCYCMTWVVFPEKGAQAQEQHPSDDRPYSELSGEDRAIIQDLSLLENLEYLEKEDIDFLQEYDQVIKIDEDGRKVYE